MRGLIVFLFLSLGCIQVLFSQKNISVSLNQGTLVELFNIIENQTDYRIFYNPENTEGIPVSISNNNVNVIDALKFVLAKTDLKVSAYENMIFIIKDKELITEWTFDNSDDPEEKTYKIPGILSKQAVKATSENIVYEVGNPAASDQNGTVRIEGDITDFKTGSPVIGASIFIKDGTGAVTDLNGHYVLEIPQGKHELNLQGIGLRNTSRQVMAYSDGKLDIEMEEQAHLLDEITVSSDRLANVRSTTMGLEKIKIGTIKNIPSAFGEVDIMKAVMSLPGVKSTGEVSNGFNVRGGATDQNLILFNDGTIYNPTHLFGLFSVFNPDVIKDMEFYKSSIPAKYGGRISSVLDINTKDGEVEKFTGAASIGLLTSRLILETPIVKGKTSLILAGRTTYSDWMLKLLPEKSGFRNGNAGFYDLNALISHKVNESNSIYASAYFSRDRFSFDANEKYAYQNLNASVRWRQSINKNLTATYSGGYDHYDFNTKDTETASTAYDLRFGINQGFGKADFRLLLGENQILSFGLNTLFYALQPGEYTPEGAESLVTPDRIQEERALESALYIGHLWDITPKFSLDLGIRLSMFNVLGKRSYNLYDPEYLPSVETITEEVTDAKGILKTYLGPEFRISTRYAFTNDFSVKAGFNTMRQYIHKISNSTVMSPTDTWKLSDVNIKPQTGLQASLGFYKNFANGLVETSIEGYYKTMNNYLDYRNGAELVMNHHLETDVLNTEGRAYGVELMIKKTQGKLNGWLSYSYSRTELRQSDKRILSPVNGGNWYPADFDKPHDVKFVGNYKFTQRYSFSLNCEYSTGRPITLPVSKFEYEGGEYVYYSDRNKYRIPDYFRMDVAFNIEPSHNLTLLTHSMISIGVYNVTGRKNPYSVFYVQEDGKLKGYQMAIFGVPIPYISYNIRF